MTSDIRSRVLSSGDPLSSTGLSGAKRPGFPGYPNVRLGIIPFAADRSLLRPVEMFFMFDDAEVQVELVSGWLRVTQPTEIDMYADAFTRLERLAVFDQDARALINAAIQQLP